MLLSLINFKLECLSLQYLVKLMLVAFPVKTTVGSKKLAGTSTLVPFV